jgi:hypothetical protein
MPFKVRVLAADEYYNPIQDAPKDQVNLFATDNQASIEPAQTRLVNGQAEFTITLAQGGNQVLRANNLSNAEINGSEDSVVDVLVGGLHYEIVLETGSVTSGEDFTMHVFFKNGIGENVTSANHLVHLSAVSAVNLNEEIGDLLNANFILQAGQRTISQRFAKTGTIRIKVEDEIGTEAAYSDPLEITAGGVASAEISAAKTEVGGLQETPVTVNLTDASGNVVPGKEVEFSIRSGTGSLLQSKALSDSTGKASVTFQGGRVTETNYIVATVDSLETVIEIVVNLTSSDLADGKVINYPNPFGMESETTRFDYYLSEDADVTIKIFDLFGNLVWSEDFQAGTAGGLGRANSVHPKA